MTRNAPRILFHPFHSGELALPEPGDRILFAGAGPDLHPPEGWQAEIVPVQGFRPYFNALVRSGYSPRPDLPDDRFETSMVLCGQHRGQNEAWFAAAVQRTRPGGLVIVAGDKTTGIASMAKRIAAVFPIRRLSKYHGIVVWLRRPDVLNGRQAALMEPPQRKPADGDYLTAPGMFSHGRVDPGSALLARHLPPDLEGHVADFAAGWGYLSLQVLQHCRGVAALDLFEADFDALQAARGNLPASGVPVEFHWHDLRSEPVEPRFDAIVMNPPFHEGRAADPEIGRIMIRAAAAALKRGGRLFMVANRQLPYEHTLGELFPAHGELADENGFKVLWGRKR